MKCTDCVYNGLIYTIRRVKILILRVWLRLYYRRDHTFDVKTCFQQTRYVFDVIVTSWALFVFCISWNYARDIWTVFEEIKHQSCTRKYIINHWGLMKKKYFGWSGLYFIFILHLYMTVTCRHIIVFYYLFSVFRGIMPAIFGRFSKKLSTSRAPEKYFTRLLK
jgi:hypothetical protein